MHQWVQPDYLFDGQTRRGSLAFLVENGVVSEVVDAGETPDETVPIPVSGTVSPGFVDLQVNGGGGVLFNASASVEGLDQIAGAHRKLGTCAILPTVITDAPEVLPRAAAAVMSSTHPSIVGIHIEGPHISEAKRGTHDARFIRPMDDVTLDAVQKLRAASVPVMITVAPEAVSPAQISQLADMGAVVAIGHTNAPAEDVLAAIKAGAACGTHLFNAMSQMEGRAPGAVGALINSDCHTSLICDGIHVADEMMQLAMRARPKNDRTFLVSDAMPTVGGPERFDLYGMEITVDKGRLVNAEGNLAGAHLSQAEGVARAINVLNMDPAEALGMVTSIPAKIMGLRDLMGIRGRRIDDLIVLSREFAFSGYVSDHL